MTLLQKMGSERQARRESLREETRRHLRTALRDLLPAAKVVVFGSLVKPGRFSETSDVDIRSLQNRER
jgi:predicted nucleotidyltransferase